MRAREEERGYHFQWVTVVGIYVPSLRAGTSPAYTNGGTMETTWPGSHAALGSIYPPLSK